MEIGILDLLGDGAVRALVVPLHADLARIGLPDGLEDPFTADVGMLTSLARLAISLYVAALGASLGESMIVQVLVVDPEAFRRTRRVLGLGCRWYGRRFGKSHQCFRLFAL